MKAIFESKIFCTLMSPYSIVYIIVFETIFPVMARAMSAFNIKVGVDLAQIACSKIAFP